MRWTKGYHRGSCTWDLCSAVEPTCLYRVSELIRNRWPERLIPDRGVLASFNDHPSTTLEDVILVLREGCLND